MFVITVEAAPKRGHELYKQAGGAYVNVFVDFNDLWGAKQLALLYITEQGWRITGKAIVKEVVASKTPKDVREYLKEAKRYGYSMVFNLWPKKKVPTKKRS